MVAEIFQTITSAVTAFISTLGGAVSSAMTIFYDATNGITPVGVLLLIAAGVGLVYWAFYFIRDLVRTNIK